MRCDSVVCPNPPVPDCYMNEGICAEDEWCQLEDQVRFGPWAMAGGETPNVSPGDCAFFKQQGYNWIFDQVCRNSSHWGPWQAVRGRCSKYRREQQSCNAYFAAIVPSLPPSRLKQHSRTASSSSSSSTADMEANGGVKHSGVGSDLANVRWRSLLSPLEAFHAPGSSSISHTNSGHSTEAVLGSSGFNQLLPHYAVSEEDGRPPMRPMLCGPGLVCTGDVQPMPNTCVKVRPPNTCYQGPWWDSTSWCKVGSNANNQFYAGLPLEELEEVAKALLLQLPVEHFTNPLSVKFWHSPAADVARGKIQGILAALWPQSYRAATRFPLDIPDPRHAGSVHSTGWNHTAAKAASLYHQSNKVWSTIQTLVHNMKDPMPPTQVAASRALAVWLRQHFMCCNCRGMWANYVLNHLGLPPKSSSRYDHTRWWWRAHNMVSEHAASSRGGHPWVWPSQTDEEFSTQHAQYGGKLRCQNPWFLPYEFAELMWKIPGN
uniref:Sulfhydryl oxidase n=1 Tax=Tetradesmus obliquus TaxID=3088 RepID=A0A383W1N7_TETOB|eukprot:jgi/Sobl393_1/5226/SZX71595.1